MCYLLDICIVLVNIHKYGKKFIIEWSSFSYKLNSFLKDDFLSYYGPDWGKNKPSG